MNGWEFLPLMRSYVRLSRIPDRGGEVLGLAGCFWTRKPNSYP